MQKIVNIINTIAIVGGLLLAVVAIYSIWVGNMDAFKSPLVVRSVAT